MNHRFQIILVKRKFCVKHDLKGVFKYRGRNLDPQTMTDTLIPS